MITETIPFQTGNYSYNFNIAISSITGRAEIGFGCSGISGSAMKVIMESGILKTDDGRMFSSFRENEWFTLAGYVYKTGFSIFKDGSLLVSDATGDNVDTSILFLDAVDQSGNYEISYAMSGVNEFGGKDFLLICPDTGLDSSLINLMEGISSTGDYGVILDTGAYTGVLSSDQIDTINGYDCIVFAPSATGLTYPADSWKDFTSPMVLVGALNSNSLHLNLLYSVDVSLNSIDGYAQDSIYESLCQRIDGVDTSTGRRFAFYDQDATGMSSYGTRVIGSESGVVNISSFSFLYPVSWVTKLDAGETGRLGGVAPSGDRYVFSVVESSGMSVYTNETKKLLLRTLMLA